MNHWDVSGGPVVEIPPLTGEGLWIWSPVWDLRSHTPRGAGQKKRNSVLLCVWLLWLKMMFVSLITVALCLHRWFSLLSSAWIVSGYVHISVQDCCEYCCSKCSCAHFSSCIHVCLMFPGIELSSHLECALCFGQKRPDFWGSAISLPSQTVHKGPRTPAWSAQ